MLHNVCTQDDYPAHGEQENHRNSQMQRQSTARKSDQDFKTKQNKTKQNKKNYWAKD